MFIQSQPSRPVIQKQYRVEEEEDDSQKDQDGQHMRSLQDAEIFPDYTFE